MLDECQFPRNKNLDLDLDLDLELDLDSVKSLNDRQLYHNFFQLEW